MNPIYLLVGVFCLVWFFFYVDAILKQQSEWDDPLKEIFQDQVLQGSFPFM